VDEGVEGVAFGRFDQSGASLQSLDRRCPKRIRLSFLGIGSDPPDLAIVDRVRPTAMVKPREPPLFVGGRHDLKRCLDARPLVGDRQPERFAVDVNEFDFITVNQVIITIESAVSC
jgi:hypothetical protein